MFYATCLKFRSSYIVPQLCQCYIWSYWSWMHFLPYALRPKPRLCCLLLWNEQLDSSEGKKKLKITSRFLFPIRLLLTFFLMESYFNFILMSMSQSQLKFHLCIDVPRMRTEKLGESFTRYQSLKSCWRRNPSKW